jgi:oxaloacetate decarboxylase (Na+ extruding) subunit alpha
MEVNFIDTTFRDGSQSLWALGLRTGMIETVAEAMDQAGFAAVEVPVVAIYIKKFVRDLKEDPWAMMRMAARRMPNTVKSCMAGGHILSFEAPAPRELVELFFTRIVETGVLNRAQLTSNSFDQISRIFPWIVPVFKKLGLQIAFALSYTISPRHTDAYYAQKTRDLLPFKPDAIYVKDQGGLLTIDRVRTLLPSIIRNADGVPVELHSHCTTGLADLVYLEALRLGVRTLHTAVPPLAQGPSQPSVLNIARNARLMGYSTHIDETIIRAVAERLTSIAKQEKLTIGAPLEYDHAQYIHQVPGGVISNLKHQLAEMRILHRLDEVLEESVHVRKDFGYPIMITPHSQFVVTQAAINVATGERYKLVIDELIMFAQGVYGEDSGYTWMDQNLKDKLLSMPRAAELAARRRPDVTLQQIREQLSGPGVSDEELLLRFIMKGDREIAAMRAAGPPKQYFTAEVPLVTLIDTLKKCKQVRFVNLQRGSDTLSLRNQIAVR